MFTLSWVITLVTVASVQGARTKSMVTVVVTNAVTRDTCGGVLLTRYHVLTSSQCVASQEKHFIVELVARKNQQRVAITLAMPPGNSVTVLSLSSPMTTSSNYLETSEFQPGPVTGSIHNFYEAISLLDNISKATLNYAMLLD